MAAPAARGAVVADRLLILVDGFSYLYRAFHAMPSLTNADGEPTGAIYGVTNMLRRLRRKFRPGYMAVVFDAKGKTFRDELYPQYKAHRPPMPDELAAQIEPLAILIQKMGLPLISAQGFEADDVIGTLARQAEASGMDTVISTGDKDLAQLVNGHIRLINTMTDHVLDVDGVREKFGVGPGQIIDYLALVGDSSDNIPGVPKVGPKTAAKWLEEYETLDNIIANADAIKGKIGENLRASLGQLELSRELVTIRTDVDLPLGPADLVPREPDREQLSAMLRTMEFKSWLSDVLQGGNGGPDTATEPAAQPAARDADYETVLEEAALDRWISLLEQAPEFAFDTETTGLDYMQAEVVGVSFAVTAGEAAYVPLAHDYPGAPRQLDRGYVLGRLRPLLEDPGKDKIGQNLKYDRHILANHGIDLRGIRHDTMLQSYVLDSTATRHDMDSLALKYLGHKTIHFEEVAGKGAKQLTFNQVALAQAAPYAAEDADITLRLHGVLWPKLQALPRLRELYETIEMPLVPVLERLERNGVLIDAAMLEKQGLELQEKMGRIEKEIFAAAGQEFNLSSPNQIQQILFDKLRLPVTKKTPRGQPSTAESVLQELAVDYDLPRLILEHRAMSKLKSTYTDKLPRQICPRTGRVHTSYHQAVTATGRLSSSDPNLQNIPVRTPEGRRIRQAFVPRVGYRILAADYSQIELRIMAHLSGDSALLAAFNRGGDVHRATAAEVFGVEQDAVDDDQRRSAKAINFGLIYGMSAFGLARQLGIARSAAQSYVDLYFERYPGVKVYMDATRAQAREAGYVETLFGRRLYLPEINSRNGQRRQYAERTAINAPMQGTAADIIKRAMLAVDDWIGKSGIDACMIMQVHDELVFEVAGDRLDEASASIRQLMSAAADLAVPLVVQAGAGSDWDVAH